jgi:hypothetical protein
MAITDTFHFEMFYGFVSLEVVLCFGADSHLDQKHAVKLTVRGIHPPLSCRTVLKQTAVP